MCAWQENWIICCVTLRQTDWTVLQNVNKVSALFRVKEEYLDRMFRTIYAEYGNVERFLRRGLYLNQKTVTDLQSKYLI